MNQTFLIDIFNGRKICIKGVGKLFYQEGLPVSLSILELKKNGVETSLLHVADECLKNGWSPKTTLIKLKSDFQDNMIIDNTVIELLTKFCYSSYDDQREMIFQYLFDCTTNDVRTNKNSKPLYWLRNKF